MREHVPDPDCPPVYHTPGEPLTEVLCRAMRVALRCYDEVAGDLYGQEHLGDYRQWTDYDRVSSFEVVEITPDNARRQGFTPEQSGLKLRYDTYWVADVRDLAEACDLVAAASGQRVVLVGEPEPSLPRWVPGPPGGVPDRLAHLPG